jgi:arylsulfatase A
MKRISITGVLVALLAGTMPASAAQKPNIVYVLCDDLGYGDVHCFGGERSKIATPNADRLATQGMMFTDAHSGSSVCTPTRYGILTGRYCWRTRLQSGVLSGTSPALIAPGRLTVAGLLREHGYATACIGKWHLGMRLPADNSAAGPIRDGPTTRGFDYFFGISASLDMPPFAFIENDHFTEAPTAQKKWGRTGPAAPDFEAVDVLPTLVRKAVEYIGRAKPPFFLYLALTSPHAPIVPGREWQGRSGLGDYADFVMETDWALGETLKALDKNGLAENTLVIFTSDNGCSPAAKPHELEARGHFPSWVLRGYKSDIWDGGHRIPFIARWPGVVAPATKCGQLVCLTDLMATCAEIVGEKLPDRAGEDSVSIVPLLRGENRAVREAVVHHSIQGMFAIRREDWKLEFCRGSGGWTKGDDGQAIQLYDMAGDIGEKTNLQAGQPDAVNRLSKLMEEYVSRGRSTPGATQANDAKVDLYKKTKNAENSAQAVE